MSSMRIHSEEQMGASPRGDGPTTGTRARSGQDMFEACIGSSRAVSQLLEAIHLNEAAMVHFSSLGVKVTTEKGKCLQASAFLQKSLFTRYVLLEEDISFRINLDLFLHCLGIFGDPSALTNDQYPGGSVTDHVSTPSSMTANIDRVPLKLKYRGTGSPLVVVLEESKAVTDCLMGTFDPHEMLLFEMPSESVSSKIIIDSDLLKEIWAEFDASSDSLEITVSPEEPFLRLSTNSITGQIETDIGKDCDKMHSFRCDKKQTNRYQMSLLKACLIALDKSSKTSLRFNDEGILCIQYMMYLEDDVRAFVEYYCAPEVAPTLFS